MSSLHLLMSLCLLVMTVSSNLPPPRNVRIISENFVHVLVWENNYLNASVHYITQERSQWKPVDKCSNVTNQLCDLTEYFTDLLGNYQGSVQSFTHNAISNISYSALFNPFESTALGPPIVRVTSCNKCVNLTINLPKSPTVSSDNNPILKLFNDYSIQYTIMVVTPNELARNLTKDTTEENFTAVINGLSPNTNYCVSVAVTQFGINLNTRHIPSAPQCVITEPHHLEGGYGGYMWLIGVAIAGAVIFILMLICLLVSLDKAGFICFGPHFFPKVLKSVPQSESKFFQNKNVYAPASVFAVDVIHKAEQEEDSESVDGQCGQGYAQRKKLHQSSTSAEDNSALHYSTESYSVDTSGQDSGSSAETGKAMEATLLVEIDEGCSSNTEMSTHKLESNENILLNIRDTFNVNLKSVSVGDPERLWTGLQKPFPERGQEPVATIQGSIDLPGARGLKLFTNELDTPIISESEDYCSEEEDHTSDLDEPSVSGYMRR